MRACGYISITNLHTNEISFARSMETNRSYPRFHIYIETTLEHTVIKLHLDAKQPSYEGVTAHSGEYEGTLVETEMARIARILSSLKETGVKPPHKLGF